MKKAEPYHATSSRPWNSSVILGMAVATIVMSRATRKMLRTRATTMKRRVVPWGYSMASSSPDTDADEDGDAASSLLLAESISPFFSSSMVDGARVEPPLRYALLRAVSGAGAAKPLVAGRSGPPTVVFEGEDIASDAIVMAGDVWMGVSCSGKGTEGYFEQSKGPARPRSAVGEGCTGVVSEEQQKEMHRTGLTRSLYPRKGAVRQSRNGRTGDMSRYAPRQA